MRHFVYVLLRGKRRRNISTTRGWSTIYFRRVTRLCFLYLRDGLEMLMRLPTFLLKSVSSMRYSIESRRKKLVKMQSFKRVIRDLDKVWIDTQR